jgi:hypothetical protein
VRRGRRRREKKNKEMKKRKKIIIITIILSDLFRSSFKLCNSEPETPDCF